MKNYRVITSILIAVTLLICAWPLLMPGIHLGHDGELHLGRIAAHTKALKEGQFPIRWTNQLQYSYGSPIFILTYPLPYLMGSFFYGAGASLSSSLELIVFLSLAIGLIGMYLASLKWSKDQLLSAAVAVIYTLAPYHLVNAYLRVAIGELLLMAWPGWWLWVFQKFSTSKNQAWLLALTLINSLLILSHQIMGGLTILTLLLISVLMNKLRPNLSWRKFLWTQFWTLLLAFILTIWYWLPAYKESHYTMLQQMLYTKPVIDFLLTPMQVFVTKWTTSPQSVPAMLGIPLTIAWLVIGWRALKNKTLLWLWLFTTGILFMTLNLSSFFWQNIELLAFFQTPWRLLNLTVITISLGLLLISTTKRLKFLVLVLAVMMMVDTTSKLLIIESDLIDEEYYQNYPKSTCWHWEGTPIWTDSDPTQYPKSPAQLIGDGEIINWYKKDTKQTGFISSKEPSLVVVNTFYFPGWKLLVNGAEVPIEFQDINHRGLITFPVSAGDSEIELNFERSKTRLLSELISVIGLLLLAIISLVTINQHRNKSSIK